MSIENNAETSKAVKMPGPDHPISIEPHGKRVMVTVAGEIIAESRSALLLREASYPPVFYIPRQDVDMAKLVRSTHSSHCPYKGDAAYFSIPSGGERSVNAVWTYEAPHSAVALIKDHLAFYTDRDALIEERAR